VGSLTKNQTFSLDEPEQGLMRVE